MKNKKIARLSVVEFTPQGHGLAYHEEKPVEIKNSIPGDDVTVQLLRKRKIHQMSLKQCGMFFNQSGPLEFSMQDNQFLVFLLWR